MPTIQKFTPKVIPGKDWGTELLVAHTPEYTGKVLAMKAGKSGPLQYHERKNETFFLFSGRAIVRFHDEQGQLQATTMYPGQSFHVPPGAVHQVEAIDECVFFEASNPIFDDRVAVDG